MRVKTGAFDWDLFRQYVQRNFKSGHEVHQFLGGGRQTAYNAYNGLPIGLIPCLRLCQRMRVHPGGFYVETRR